MPQIYKPYGFGQSIGESLAKGVDAFSGTVSQSLNQLTNAKMQELLKRSQYAEREKQFNAVLPPELKQYAPMLSRMSDAAAAPFMKELAAGPRYQREAQMTDEARRRALGEEVGSQAMEGSQEPQSSSFTGISPQVAKTIADIELKGAGLKQKERHFQQKMLLDTYKPTIKHYQEVANEADHIIPYVEDMIKLVKSGKVEQNAWKYMYENLPLSQFNSATQQFINKGKNVVARAANMGKRGATNAVLQNWEESKASIFQDQSAQLASLEDTLKWAKSLQGGRKAVQDSMKKGTLSNELLDNISKEVSKPYKNDFLKVGSTYDELPNISEVPVGFKTYDSEKDVTAISDGKDWKFVKGKVI